MKITHTLGPSGSSTLANATVCGGCHSPTEQNLQPFFISNHSLLQSSNTLFLCLPSCCCGDGCATVACITNVTTPHNHLVCLIRFRGERPQPLRSVTEGIWSCPFAGKLCDTGWAFGLPSKQNRVQSRMSGCEWVRRGAENIYSSCSFQDYSVNESQTAAAMVRKKHVAERRRESRVEGEHRVCCWERKELYWNVV